MSLSAMNKLPNQEQFAQIMGVTVVTLIKWEKEGMPVAFRRGRFVLYDKALTDRWLKYERRRITRRTVWRSAWDKRRAGEK